MPRQGYHILKTGHERGQVDDYTRDALKEVAAEPSTRKCLPDAVLNGAYHSEVDALLGWGAEGLHVPRLEHSQDLCLGVRSEAFELVQEEGPPVGAFHVANLGIDCAGERPTSMAEQQALDHLARQRTTVHVHQRSRPPAPLVNMLGEQLLACPRRADQQDWERRPGVALRKHERPPDGG